MVREAALGHEAFDAQPDWLDQSMDDRADEAAAAIAWARARPDIDGDRIGLWGAGRAGRVLPKIAARTPVSFVIAVSPAINWLRQGRHHLLAEPRADGASAGRVSGPRQRAASAGRVSGPRQRAASAGRVTAEVARSDSIRRLPARRATVEEYVGEAGGDADGMTAGRWGFLSRNHTADATRDLRALRGVPVLLVLAGHDVSVDTAETEDVYHQVLGAGRALTVERHPDATHSPLRRSVEQSERRTALTALLAPRSLFADGFLDGRRQFLEGRGRAGRTTPRAVAAVPAAARPPLLRMPPVRRRGTS
ncbi:alpha/beta hydrolase [Streptomyces sp. NPDC001985]|uniref:alpha/beta hydrolase n=1 Tax=Streptomyces sp. NPDC001985 TaxID=3154406 RepID=UPI003330381D